MRWPALATLGVAAYAVFLAATLPAAVVVERMRPEGGLRLEDAQGTFWNGSARGVIFTARPPVTIERLHWRFAPAQLLAGRFAFDVTSTDAALRGKVRLARGFDALRAELIDVKAQASVVPALVPLAAPWRPQGTLSLQGGHLQWDGREELRGDAIVQWDNASLSLPDPRLLGSYRVVLRGEGGPMRATLTTLNGALQLRGEGTVAPNAVRVQGEARAQGANADAMQPVLDLLGPRRPDGSRELVLRWP